MTKVTVYIEDDTWARFKRQVLRRTGTLRRMSEELQKVVQDSLIEETLLTALKNLGYGTASFPSADAIVPVRPRRRTSSAEAIRELRETRHGAAVPRQ